MTDIGSIGMDSPLLFSQLPPASGRFPNSYNSLSVSSTFPLLYLFILFQYSFSSSANPEYYLLGIGFFLWKVHLRRGALF